MSDSAPAPPEKYCVRLIVCVRMRVKEMYVNSSLERTQTK